MKEVWEDITGAMDVDPINLGPIPGLLQLNHCSIEVPPPPPVSQISEYCESHYHCVRAPLIQLLDQCTAPSLMYFLTRLQYWSRCLSLRAFPHFTMMRKAKLAARPMKAADMKQFWVPRLVNHGVIP